MRRVRELRDAWRRGKQRGTTYPHELAFLLENPLRRLLLSPGALADRLQLSPDARVLEIGPGPGYFSGEVARRLPRGRLELFDLQREMLVKARRKLSRAGVANAGFTQGDAGRLPYRSGCFDVVFLVTVLGEVPETAACLREIQRVLRPGGLLSVTEQIGDPDRVPFDELRSAAERAGLRLDGHAAGWASETADFRR